MGRHLAAFDPSLDFKAIASFRAGGLAWVEGRPFDKAVVDKRTLRLLYENHKIRPLTQADKAAIKEAEANDERQREEAAARAKEIRDRVTNPPADDALAATGGESDGQAGAAPNGDPGVDPNVNQGEAGGEPSTAA